MPAAQRLFFLPGLLLPAISVSPNRIAKFLRPWCGPSVEAELHPAWTGQSPVPTRLMRFDLTSVGGMLSSRPQSGWLARPHLRTYFHFVLLATLVSRSFRLVRRLLPPAYPVKAIPVPMPRQCFRRPN